MEYEKLLLALSTGAITEPGVMITMRKLQKSKMDFKKNHHMDRILRNKRYQNIVFLPHFDLSLDPV